MCRYVFVILFCWLMVKWRYVASEIWGSIGSGNCILGSIGSGNCMSFNGVEAITWSNADQLNWQVVSSIRNTTRWNLVYQNIILFYFFFYSFIRIWKCHQNARHFVLASIQCKLPWFCSSLSTRWNQQSVVRVRQCYHTGRKCTHTTEYLEKYTTINQMALAYPILMA